MKSCWAKSFLKSRIKAQKGDVIDKISILGYKEISPYKNRDYLIIDTLDRDGKKRHITMKGVNKPLIGIDMENGISRVMYPNEDNIWFPSRYVLEIPLKGRKIRRKTKFSSGGQINGMTPDEFLEKADRQQRKVEGAIDAYTGVAGAVADFFIPGAGQLIGDLTNKIYKFGYGLFNKITGKDKKIKQAEEMIARNKDIGAEQQQDLLNKYAMGYQLA